MRHLPARSVRALVCAACLFASGVARAQGTPEPSAPPSAPARGPSADSTATTADTTAATEKPTSAPASEPAKPLPAALAPQLALSLSPTSGLMVGDVLTVKLEAVVPNGVDVAVPEQSLAPFEVLDRRVRSEAANGKQRYVFELDLMPLEAGTVEVPALRVRVVGPKGELGETSTSARSVRVGSPIGNEPNAQPKPPTKPRVVIQDDYTLAWVLGGLLAALLVIVITLLVQRWLARRPKVAPPPPPPRAPWEVALEKLDQLARRKESLLSQNRGEEFIEGVSAILREYLGRRYGFEGLESTTDEILRTLERLRPHKLSLSGVSLLLEQCDLVKFARATPDEAQCDDLWNGALGLVRATTPPPEPAAAPLAEAAR